MSEQEPPENPEPAPSRETNDRTRRSIPAWIIALVVVLVAGGGFLVYRLVTDGATSASGDCVSVDGVDDTAATESVDCDSEQAHFKLASTRDLAEPGCPEGAYREVRTDSELLCLMPNFVADTCYAADDANNAFVVADCDSPESIRISRVLEGTTDPTPCPDGSGLGYPDPPVVFCIETPGMS